MNRLTRDDWGFIFSALYYAAEWQKSVADSFNVPGWSEQRTEALKLADKFMELHQKVKDRV